MGRGATTMALTAAMLTTVVAVIAPASAYASPAETAPTDPTCTGNNDQPGDPGTAPLLSPGWSDGAGWTNPEQYQTILSGDVDGDGVGELVGRNSTRVEVFTWDGTQASQGRYGKFSDPVPGQWRQVVPQGSQASFATTDGWWDPSRYSTMRLADIDGDGADELITRDPSAGIEVYPWDADTRTWVDTPVQGPAWTDADSTQPGGITDWGQEHPDHYSTISTGDVNGDGAADLIGRATDGVHAFSYDASTSTWTDLGGPNLSDDNGYAQPQYYPQIRAADIDGDNIDEIIWRADDGYHAARYAGGTSWTDVDSTSGPFPDFDAATGTHWDQPIYDGSLTVGDVNADGAQDVIGRSVDGLEAWTLKTGTWQLIARHAPGDTTAPADAYGWNEAPYASTVQAGDVLPLGGDEIVARGGSGLRVWAVVGGAWVRQAQTIAQFSDANGWAPPYYDAAGNVDATVPGDMRYSTIEPVTVQDGQTQLVIGRDSTGIRTFAMDGTNPSAQFPSYTNLTLDGVPIPNALPPADPGISPQLQNQLSQLTPAGRVFWYLDAKAARNFGWSMPAWIDTPAGPTQVTRPTIVDELRNQAVDIGGLHSAVQGYDPGDEALAAQNVDRDTYNGVRQDVADWTGATDNLRRVLLGSQGMQQLFEQSFVTNAGQVQNVLQAFESSDKLWTLFADLVWGAIGSIGLFVDEATFGAATPFLQLFFNMAGASISAEMGWRNPNGRVEAQAAQMQDQIVDTFCGASAYIDWANDFIVQDLGLMTSLDDALRQMFIPSTSFTTIVNGLTQTQDVWIWQQFANIGPDDTNRSKMFWLGRCDGTSGCEWTPDSAMVFTAPENPDVTYRLMKGDGKKASCSDSVHGDSTYAAFVALNVPPENYAGPRTTDLAPGGMPAANPMGLSGWNLQETKCN